MLSGMPSIPNLISPNAIVGSALSLGGAALIGAVFGKRWGIFNEFGVPILLADSFISLSYDGGSSISKYPVEKGSFASYNKVDQPSMATVTLAKGGDSALKRGLFLTQLELLRKSTLAFHIITPEYVYMKYQIVGINLTRTTQESATLIKVNLDLEEVLEAKVEYDTEEVKEPSDSNTVDGGAKQATPNESALSQMASGAKSFSGIGKVIGGVFK